MNQYQGCKLWILSFTASVNAPILIPVEKLLVEHGDYPARETRRISGLHTKLFLVMGKSVKAAFIGSQNAVAPTTDNLMVHITTNNQLSWLKKHFNYYWEQAE